MAKKSAKKSNVARIIAGAILGVLLLGLLGAMIWFILDRTNGGTEDFKTFTFEIDGKRIRTEKTTAGFAAGEHTATVNYLFGDYDYTVSFQPKADVKFDYSVDGKIYPWSDTKDLNAAFSLKKSEKGFTFTVPASLSDVLGKLHDGEITFPDGIPADRYLYTLTVSSYNEAMIYTIDFALLPPIGDVDVTPGEIELP